MSAALGLGAAGALVDVSSYVKLDMDSTVSYGRTRQYDDIEPGSFSFVLDNQDGRFTPDNPASPYATTLVEGAAACLQVGSRLTPGRVQSIEPTFPDGETGRAYVRVVCSDMLGDLSRDELANGWREAVVRAADPVGYYPFDDAADSAGAADQSGTNRGTYLFEPTLGEVLFEQPGVEHDRIRVTGEGSMRLYGVSIASVSAGRCFSFWIQPIVTTGTFSLKVAQLTFAMTSGFFQLASDFPSVITSINPVVAGREYFVEVDSVNLTLKVDGVLQGTLAGTTVTPFVGDPVEAFWGDATPTDFYWSDFALTQNPVAGDAVQRAFNGGGAARWLELLDAASNDLTLGALPAGLALAPLFVESSGAGLTVLNQIMKAEQGHAFSTGSGTLLDPVEVVTVRERVRPETVSASFDVALDLKESPQFERPIRDLVSRVQVDTPFGRVTVLDSTVASRAGSASTVETVPLSSEGDARAWAQDRIIRGSNIRLQAMSIVIDAMTTQTDRSADLLALKPGDRIRLTNLPTTQLGYSSWDAWVVGAKETHGLTAHTFELHIAPVLDAPHLFDTARFASGTSIKLGRSVRTNLAPNPCTGGTLGLLAGGRATLSDGGTFVRATISDALAVTLAQILTTTTSSGAAMSAVVPGDVVTVQAEARASVHPQMAVAVQFFNSSLAFISGSQTQGIATSVNATTFVPLSTVTATAPAGAAFARWLVGLAGTAPRAIGDTFDARRVMVEIAPAAYPYFDGDTTDTADAAYDWAGTPKQSPSTEKRQTMTTTATVIEASTLGPLLTTTEEPFDILIGSEQMTVVDVAGTSSPQTVRLVRGVNGTAAAGHASGDPIEVTPTAVFAF